VRDRGGIGALDQTPSIRTPIAPSVDRNEAIRNVAASLAVGLAAASAGLALTALL
jgi:hypothetical protein